MKTVVRISIDIPGKILDIGGGGEGIIGKTFGKRVTAVDRDKEELEVLNGISECMVMDACNLQFPDSSFDNVTFFYSLMYMDSESSGKSLKEAVRVLNPGGNICIWDKNPEETYPGLNIADLTVYSGGSIYNTTYGASYNKDSGKDQIIEIMDSAGLSMTESQEKGKHFFLIFTKIN